MDIAFWQAITEQDYAVPAGYTVEDLTPYLLAALGNTDPRVREGPNHEVLETWIHRGMYSDEAMRTMANQMLANLSAGIGESGTDTVFLRTFSLLILNEIIEEDNQHPFLAEAEVRSFMERGLAYLAAERDVRGYVVDKGWAHAVAHAADFLMVLARNRYLQAPDLEHLLQAGSRKLSETTTRVYLYEEDERLAYAVMTALRRNLLQLSFLTKWIEQLARPDDIPWSIETFYTQEHTVRYHNLKAFLRSLYFQLRLASPPQIAPDLLPILEDAIQAMDRGYYALP